LHNVAQTSVCVLAQAAQTEVCDTYPFRTFFITNQIFAGRSARRRMK
jgi:hypothetical protein